MARVSDPKLDELLDVQGHLVDAKQRVGAVRAHEDYIINQAYILPLYWSRRTTTVDASVQGYVAAPTNYVGIDLSRFDPKNVPQPRDE